MVKLLEGEGWFGDEEGGYYFASDRHKNLIVRTKPFYDGAVPSGNAVAARALLRTARVSGNEADLAAVEGILDVSAVKMNRQPLGVTEMLAVLGDFLGKSREMVIVGNAGESDTERLLQLVQGAYIPNRVLLFSDASSESSDVDGILPLLAGRAMIDGKATLYICENNTCKKPMTDAVEIANILRLSVN